MVLEALLERVYVGVSEIVIEAAFGVVFEVVFGVVFGNLDVSCDSLVLRVLIS